MDDYWNVFPQNDAKSLIVKHAPSRENGAMIEVFYEQLNFEMLSESEAYGVMRFSSHTSQNLL
uniref:Uncharacterized protein n=1 Tax=Parascaris equorum TaxID=6256 RepID=A0A914S986_PAREQ